VTAASRVWFVTYTALVLLIGASGGALGAHYLMRPPGPGPFGPAGVGGPAGPPPDRLIGDLDRVLQLTADQKARIRDVLDAHLPRIQALQREARDQFVAEQNAVHADIAALLTPDQAVRFDAMAPHLPPPGRGGRGGLLPPMGGAPGQRGRGGSKPAPRQE
jgi:hypothetical protein